MEAQTFANHVRRHPPFHFFIVPVMLINVIWAIVNCVMAPGWNTAWSIVFSLTLVLLTLLVRLYPIKAQDRIILLEERLRYQHLLSAELAQKAGMLEPRQIIALRFAGDNELETLVGEVLAGRLTKPGEIKSAVKNWRADTYRV